MMHKMPPLIFYPRFKICKTWSSHEGCKQVIDNAWKIQIIGPAMYVLHKNLKNIKTFFWKEKARLGSFF